MKKMIRKIILWAFGLMLVCLCSNSFAQTWTQTFSGNPVQVNTWRGGESFDSFLRLPYAYANVSNLDSCGRLYFDKARKHAMYLNNCTGLQQVFTMADTAQLRVILGGSGGTTYNIGYGLYNINDTLVVDTSIIPNINYYSYIDTLNGYNIFDGDVTYGSYYVNSTGNILTNSVTSRSTNLIKVTPNTTYTAQGYGWRGDGNYGLFFFAIFYDSNIANNTYYQGFSQGVVGYNSLGQYRTFTTGPNTTYIGLDFDSHSYTGFEDSFLLTVGGVRLPYESPDSFTVRRVFKDTFFAKYNETHWTNTQVDSVIKLGAGKMTVVVAKPLYYLRTSWNSDSDMVQILTDSANGYPPQYVSTNIIPKGIASDAASLQAACAPSASFVVPENDDLAPSYFNSTYQLGSHGASFVIPVYSPGHLVDNNSVGATFTDGVHTFTMLKNESPDTVWVIGQNLGGTVIYNYVQSISGSTLTYVSGGSGNTNNIPVTSYTVGTQLQPFAQNLSYAFTADTTSITSNGIYYCNNLKLNMYLSAPDVDSIVSYVKSTKKSDFNNSSIKNAASESVQLTWDKYGNNTIQYAFRNYENIYINTFGYFAATQSQCINVSGTDSIYALIPATKSFTLNGHYYNYANVENITGTIDADTLWRSKWIDTTRPPYWLSFLRKTSTGTPVFNLTTGYSPISGVTALGNRPNYVGAAAGFLYSSKKFYPFFADSLIGNSFILPTNNYLQVTAFRSKQNPALNPNTTSFAFYQEGDNIIAFVDYQKNVTLDTVSFNTQDFNGYSISKIDSSSNNIVLNSTYIDNGKMYVTVSNVDTAKGEYLILKLSKSTSPYRLDTTSLSNRINVNTANIAINTTNIATNTTAIAGKADTGTVYQTTKTYLAANYWKLGGNTPGTTAILGTTDGNNFALAINGSNKFLITGSTLYPIIPLSNSSSPNNAKLDFNTNNRLTASRNVNDITNAALTVVNTGGLLAFGVAGVGTVYKTTIDTNGILTLHTSQSSSKSDSLVGKNSAGQLVSVGRQYIYSGTATLSAGTVTVSNTNILTGTAIKLTLNTASGTCGFLAAPSASIVSGTSFIINSVLSTGLSNTADNSTVNWSFTISY